MLYDVAIIGAGAAGLMTAALLKDKSILLLEQNEKPAKKLRIAGGGRCNLTNAKLSAQNYLGDRAFIAQVLERFDNHALLDYFHQRGLQTSLEKDKQYFCTHSAQDLIDILLHESRHAHIKLHQKLQSIEKKSHFILQTQNQSFKAKKVLMASGGSSFSKLGTSDIALHIAQSFKHTIRAFEPVLVGLTLQKEQAWMKELSGISVLATLTIGKKSFTNWLLFAHKGISGPAVLSSSLYWKKSSITIDFLPQYRLKSLFKQKNKKLSQLIPLPKRLTLALLEALELENKPYAHLNSQELERLSHLKSYSFAPAGNFGLSKAEAVRGGVETTHIDPHTLQSRHTSGLFFAGEALDVTGELGGYNIQWAFSSAFVVAQALK